MSYCLFLVSLSIQLQCTTCISNSSWHLNRLLGISLQCHLCHLSKRVFNMYSLDCTCFIEHHIVIFFCPRLSLRCRYLSRALLIKFVSKTHEGESLRIGGTSIFDEARLPSVKIFETLRVSHVIHECAAVCSPVKGVAERLKLLLAGGIPDLQGNDRVVD